MNGDRLRETLSRHFDGELAPHEIAEAEELASSEEARTYLKKLEVLRRNLRYEPAGGPDVTGEVLRAIQQTRSRRGALGLRVAAAFVAGVVAGAVFIGITLRQPAPVAAADIPERVLAAQGEVTSLTARLSIVERGWHPEVTERTYRGRVAYRAPESLWLEIRDETAYPSDAWVPNHSTLVVDEDIAWSRSVAGCPTEALPDCTPEEPRLAAITAREPFPDAQPAPLDLIVPASGFTRADEPELVGVARVEGRPAVGVRVTAAQVASLLDGLTSAGNWREVHPTDVVELWLDEDALVPLAILVSPADTPDRALWAIRRGYLDEPGIPVLEVSWSEVALGAELAEDVPRLPEDALAVSFGFRDGTPASLGSMSPQQLPDGMALHRSGTIVTGSGPAVSVASWSNGRAWLKVRWTDEWAGSRLFGDLGALVRQVPVGAGVAYLNERGDRVGLHSRGVDVVITGSLTTPELLRIAESLEITGLPVPAGWAEASTATMEDALAAVPGLMLPARLEGFETPAIKVEAGVATFAYPGPGNRGFVMTQAVGDELSPPLEANVRGVPVRGVEGRYSPDRGLLEWVEGDLTISMASATMTLDELVAIAELLEGQ